MKYLGGFLVVSCMTLLLSCNGVTRTIIPRDHSAVADTDVSVDSDTAQADTEDITTPDEDTVITDETTDTATPDEDTVLTDETTDTTMPDEDTVVTDEFADTETPDEDTVVGDETTDTTAPDETTDTVAPDNDTVTPDTVDVAPDIDDALVCDTDIPEVTAGDFTVKSENCEAVVTVTGSGLMWQRDISTTRGDQHAAAAYCDGLVYAGHDDWRLPTISELRLIVRGCAAVVTGGSCGVTDACPSASCYTGSCPGCTENAGPGEGGWYWQAGIWNWQGDIYGNHWSSSIPPDSTSEVWYIAFNFGGIYKSSWTFAYNYARCVR